MFLWVLVLSLLELETQCRPEPCVLSVCVVHFTFTLNLLPLSRCAEFVWSIVTTRCRVTQEVKAAIQEREGVPMDQQLLVFVGELPLSDEQQVNQRSWADR